MTTASKRLLGRRPRPRPLLLQPAELGELCEPGTCGRLRLKAEVGDESVEHTGRYVYVGSVRGLHAFAPAGEPVLFLHRSEVVSFKAGRR
jgi:hypothetical protein